MASNSGPKKKFKTKIVAIGPSGAWSEIQIPFSVENEWGSRARVSVRGTMNGFAFRSSIFPDGRGGHTMMMNKALMEGSKAGPGDTVTFEMQQDTKPRPIIIPKDFKAALAGSAKARGVFEAFSPSHCRAYVDWITQAKRAETRTARIAKAIQMIAAGNKRM
ncbi:MAG TPA: YdeI/OmpD-associated family protein [Candidatus Acidoferrum sp.]|nr:YdeI/OmpD-associated family protein [Candidatus Acidoferrum sp.]